MLGGRYELVRLIGMGGMGQVWEALDLGLGRRVAVKMLASGPTADPAATARFKREGRALAVLQSPHIVEVYDVGDEQDLLYLVMELLEGEDLGDILNRRRRLSLAEARALFTPVLTALKEAHQRGIIHRDLKPSNIVVARSGDGAAVKLLDFGIAKLEKPSDIDLVRTATHQMMGSPVFMSPEQTRGLRSLDHRSDLFSLGAVIYLALTGVLPFAPESQALGEVVYAILTTEPPLPSTFPGLGAGADTFFARALAKDPAQRFGDADEMLAALLALTDGAPPVDLRTLLTVPEAAPGAAPPPQSLAFDASETALAADDLAAEDTKPGEFRSRTLDPGVTFAPSGAARAAIPSRPPAPALATGVGATRRETLEALPPSPHPWLALGGVLPGTLRPHADLITRFLRALFGRCARESAHVAQLFEPSFPAPSHYRFFAVFLVGEAQPGRLATQTFILQSRSLEEHLDRLDKGSRKVVLAIGDSFELGAGVRQRIFALYRAHNAMVVPVHVARLRAVADDRNALDLFQEGLSDFNALPDPFAVNARAVDPTSLFGMRALLGDLLRALERPALVSVHGPPGCGKTSLVEMARGELLDTRVARVRCV
ncbi:hypothetical protein BE17_46700, partial [Sorangium cellulosum]